MSRHINGVLTVALLAVAIGAAALSMADLIRPESWFTPMAIVLATTAVVLVLARWWLVSPWLPSLLGLLAGGYAVAVLFTEGQGWAAPLPGVRAPAQLLTLLREGIDDAATTSAPVVTSPGLALAVTAGALISLVLAEVLALGYRAPVWSGLPLLLPWLPAIMLGTPAPAPVFIVAAGAYLGVLVLQAAGRQREPATAPAGALASAGVAAALAVVVGLVAAPAVLRAPVPAWQVPGGGGSGTRLDLGLDVREHLTRGADDVVLRYRAEDPGQVGPLHAYTLTEFNGRSWERSTPEGETTAVGDDVLWPEEVQTAEGQHVQVDLVNLDQDRLMLPGEPRRLELQGAWSYDAGRDEVLGTAPTPLEYQIEFFPRPLDPHTLDAAAPGQPGGPDALHVPDTGHQEQIAALTERVVTAAQARTPYQQAVAIQDHLRRDSHFTYDLQVDPARTADAVWDFLGSGRGYCVQFATAMVVMARTLGIPARLAVGFLEGTEDGDGTVEISGHRAHTWPQLHFDGVGWVRFEPTPPVRTGGVPAWAAGLAADAQDPEDLVPPETAAQTPAPQPDAASPRDLDPEAAAGSGEVGGGATWSTVALLAVAGLALAWGWRVRYRRRGNIEVAWADVAGAAATLGGPPASETPRALVERLALPAPGGTALGNLAAAVERHRYARPGGPAPEPSTVRGWREQILAGVRNHPARGTWSRRWRHLIGGAARRGHRPSSAAARDRVRAPNRSGRR